MDINHDYSSDDFGMDSTGLEPFSINQEDYDLYQDDILHQTMLDDPELTLEDSDSDTYSSTPHAEISFGAKYSDAEIQKMESDVNMAEHEMKCREDDLLNWRSKVSLNDTKEHHDNGDYDNAVSHYNEALSRYNAAVNNYNKTLSILNNAR